MILQTRIWMLMNRLSVECAKTTRYDQMSGHNPPLHGLASRLQTRILMQLSKLVLSRTSVISPKKNSYNGFSKKANTNFDYLLIF